MDLDLCRFTGSRYNLPIRTSPHPRILHSNMIDASYDICERVLPKTGRSDRGGGGGGEPKLECGLHCPLNCSLRHAALLAVSASMRSFTM
jgi:hypothetical protein